MKNPIYPIGQKFTVIPTAVNASWRKPRVAEIVDNDWGTFNQGYTYFIKVEKISEIQTLEEKEVLDFIDNGSFISNS
jgi:hypothetical protein